MEMEAKIAAMEATQNAMSQDVHEIKSTMLLLGKEVI